jgi:hypothetical protein
MMSTEQQWRFERIRPKNLGGKCDCLHILSGGDIIQIMFHILVFYGVSLVELIFYDDIMVYK